jgi:hypothetical protein
MQSIIIIELKDYKQALREDFPNLAFLGPNVFLGSDEKVYIVFDTYMMKDLQFLSNAVQFLDYGEGKRKKSIAEVTNIQKMEDHWKIKLLLA